MRAPNEKAPGWSGQRLQERIVKRTRQLLRRKILLCQVNAVDYAAFTLLVVALLLAAAGGVR